ncbi:MAG: DUF1049 domain-containing protein [Croceibacterium sp.]
MQIVRTIVWVLLLTALLVFSFANWDPTVTVKIWTNLVVETKLPAIVVISFLIGFVPMWLLHRANKWQLSRRISGLEATSRAATTIPVVPAATVDERVVVPADQPAPIVRDESRDPPPGL